MWRRRCHHLRRSRQPFWVSASIVCTVLPLDEGKQVVVVVAVAPMSSDVNVAVAVAADGEGSVTVVRAAKGG